MRALVLGGAACVWEDEARARRFFTPDIVIATNHTARDYEPGVDHWVSFHVELFPKWIAERRAKGLPDFAGQLWTADGRGAPVELPPVRKTRNWGGSSGLLAVRAALDLGCTRVVLAGVPLDRDQAHYDDPRPWSDAGNYRRGWLDHRKDMGGRVRSMSGWTRETLGAPDPEWIHVDAADQ